MPKRKALGPVENSDGEEDYYSFPSTPIQSPFPKSVPNNFHRPSSPKKSSTTAGLPPMFSFGNAPAPPPQVPKFGQGQGFAYPEQQIKAPPFGLGNQDNSKAPLIGILKRPRSQEFSNSVKDLNSAFISSCRASFAKNPSHSLIPVVKDYLYHSRELMEKHRKEGDSVELVNGINPPPKSFRSLGEFFDDFEQTYIGGKEDNHEDPGGRSSRMSTSTNSDTSSTLSSASEKSSGFSFNPSPLKDNAKSLGPPFTSSASDSPFKLNASSAASALKTALEGGKSVLSTSSNSFMSSTAETMSKPLQTTMSSPTPTLKITGTEEANVEKPVAKAPFSGFSFFNSIPKQSTSLSLNPAATTAPPKSTDEKNNDEEEGEEDEPPKVELKPVVEDDSVYSIRCKVFNVVEGKCIDKGVGMLYVKKLDGGKYQIVVRADNNLGTVILNILLQKSLPLDRKSKNMIMTMDLQGNKQKGMPIVLKVKSEDDATQLLAKLKEFQESS